MIDHPMDPELDDYYEQMGALVESAPPVPTPPEPVRTNAAEEGSFHKMSMNMGHSGGSNDENVYERMVKQTRALAGKPCEKESCSWCETCFARETVRMLDTPPVSKYGIVHPSDRILGLRYGVEEVWGADDHPILFDTIAEAEARIKERTEQYPNGGWRMARIVRHVPGVDKVYPTWKDL